MSVLGCAGGRVRRLPGAAEPGAKVFHSSGDYRLRPMPIAHILSAFPKRSLATLILLTSLQSQALTLGRIQGAALIGRPLAVSINVQFDPAQSLTSACFEADVFHGDSKQDPSRVKVRLEPAASGQGNVLRVISDTPVNEPIVTVYLRAGCAQMISRRYVMLADIVSEQAAPLPRVAAVPLVEPTSSSATPPAASAAAGPMSTSAGLGSGTASAGAATAGSGKAVTPREKRAAEAAARPPKATAVKPEPVVKPAAVKAVPVKPAAASAPSRASEEKTRAGRSAGQSRLRLDPLELLSERVATLESVSANVPADAAAREARDAQRLDSLETGVKTLVALAAKNEASLLDLRTRLERAQAERYNNPVVYLLLALLVASLLAIGYLLTHSGRRARQSPADNWWAASAGAQGAVAPVAVPAMAQEPERGPDSGLSAISEPSPLSQPLDLAQPERTAAAATQPMTQGMAIRHAGAMPAQVDVSLIEMSESSFDRLMQSGSAHSAVRKPRDDETPSVSPQPFAVAADKVGKRRRRIDSDELIDVRQRAEFFVSLGQTDQAVQVLEARIAQDSTSCPQAFLDLLALFHSLGLKSDFLQVRGDFTRIFNVQVPDFAVFDEEGRGLEDYPGTVDRLIAVWERPSVLDVMEHLLYRQDGDTAHQPFDLAGFRDLLTLYSVAQVVRDGDASGSASAETMQGFPVLDIDLSELIGEPGEPVIGMPPSAVAFAIDPATPPHTDNLIDFDLTEIPLDKKPDGT